MKRIAKARYTEEFKAAAVQLIDAGRLPAEVAREIGVVQQTLHNWLKAHREGRLGHGPKPGGKRLSDDHPLTLIRAIHARTKGAYGSPRIYGELKDAEARADVFDYIETFYNRSHRHCALLGKTPASAFEAWVLKQQGKIAASPRCVGIR